MVRLMFLLLLPSRRQPVAELDGVARAGDGPGSAGGPMMRSLLWWLMRLLLLLVVVIVPAGTTGMTDIAVWRYW